jgi:hypothetical protein
MVSCGFATDLGTGDNEIESRHETASSWRRISPQLIPRVHQTPPSYYYLAFHNLG